MIKKEDLTAAGIADEKADQILTDLGDLVNTLTPENVAKKAFDDVDLAVLTLTKIPKNANEKTTDYLKRATGDHATKLINEKTTELNTQINALKDDLKNHKGDETLKAKIAELEAEKAKLPDLREEWTKELKEKAEKAEKELVVLKKTTELRKYFPGKIKGDLTEDYVNFKKDKALEKALETYEEKEYDKDGNLILVNTKDYSKISAKVFFEKELDSIIDKGKQAQGGGGGGGEHKDENGELKLEEGMKDNEKITKIREYLATQKGISPMDPDKFNPEFNKLLKDNGLERYMTIKEEKK